MMKAFNKRLESLLLSQKPLTLVQSDLSPHVRVNTKGSCSIVVEIGADNGFDSQCELYTLVDYVSPPSWWLMKSALKVPPCYMECVSLFIW